MLLAETYIFDSWKGRWVGWRGLGCDRNRKPAFVSSCREINYPSSYSGHIVLQIQMLLYPINIIHKHDCTVMWTAEVDSDFPPVSQQPWKLVLIYSSFLLPTSKIYQTLFSFSWLRRTLQKVQVSCQINVALCKNVLYLK